jgi:hypothetical protein
MKVPDVVAIILNVLLGAFAFADAAPRSGLAFQPSLPSVGLAIRTSSCSSQQRVAMRQHTSHELLDICVY